MAEHIITSVMLVSVWFVLSAMISEQDGLPPIDVVKHSNICNDLGVNGSSLPDVFVKMYAKNLGFSLIRTHTKLHRTFTYLFFCYLQFFNERIYSNRNIGTSLSS